MSTARRIELTRNHHDEATSDHLAREGFDLDCPPLPPGVPERDLSEEHFAELLGGAAGWIVGHAKITRPLLERLPQLAVIPRRGVGFRRVDTAAVTALGRVLAIGGGEKMRRSPIMPLP